MADEDEGPALQVRRTQHPDTPRASHGLSGNPFGAPADNPFATPSPGARQPTPNPFGTPSAGQAAANNPFASSSGGPAPVNNPFATAPDAGPPSSGATPNPFAPVPDSTGGALELDRDPNEFRSNTGANKAELDEWNRTLQTGEFSIAGDPITSPGTDRSSVITGEISRPEVAALQEQAFPSSPTTGPGAAASSSPRLPRPPPTQAGGGGGSKLIPMVAGGVVLLAVVAVGGKVAYTKMNKGQSGPVVEQRVETETDAFVRQMQARGENAPDCWTSDDGYSFVYKNEAGERVRADAIAEVPVLFRKASVCVPD